MSKQTIFHATIPWAGSTDDPGGFVAEFPDGSRVHYVINRPSVEYAPETVVLERPMNVVRDSKRRLRTMGIDIEMASLGKVSGDENLMAPGETMSLYRFVGTVEW